MAGELTFQDLSVEEQIAVRQLKQRMAGCMDLHLFNDLPLFVRFLRARDLNLNAAEAMLRKHLEWRKINRIDSCFENFSPKEVFKKFVPLNVIGFDKEGSPVLYIDAGNLDFKGLFKSMRKADIIKCLVFFLEKVTEDMKEQCKKLGKYIDRWNVVINFENFSFATATNKQVLEFAASVLILYEGNYPERLKSAYLLNTSAYFTMAFNFVKPFLSEPTVKKIKIFNKDGWKEEMLRAVDENALPAFLGGNLTDPDGDPMCKTFIVHGSPVPNQYYVNKKDKAFVKQPDIQKMTVSRKAKSQLALNITEAGSNLEWEFETKTRDIGFSLFYKKNDIDPRLKELIPKQRIDTEISSEAGVFRCDDPGIYIIEFDNSYSWIFQKEVYYRVCINKRSYTQQHT